MTAVMRRLPRRARRSRVASGSWSVTRTRVPAFTRTVLRAMVFPPRRSRTVIRHDRFVRRHATRSRTAPRRVAGITVAPPDGRGPDGPGGVVAGGVVTGGVVAGGVVPGGVVVGGVGHAGR